MSDRLLLGLAGLTSLTWGLTGIFVRLLPSVSPVAVASTRLLIAFVVALPMLLLFKTHQRSIAMACKTPVAYLLAILLVAYYLLATTAFQLAPVAEVALLLSTPPLFVLALRCVWGQKPALIELCGALVALVGMVIILLPKILHTAAWSLQQISGDLAALAAALMTALYAFFYKTLTEQAKAPNAIGVSLLTFALGGMMLGLVMTNPDNIQAYAQLNYRDLGLFMGLGIVSTALPTLGFALASKRLPAVITASISLLIPLFAGLAGFLILEEQLTPGFLLGSMLVIAGVILIIRQAGLASLNRHD